VTNKIKKYTPGFNIHDVEKKYNLKKVVKLASNENPFISKDVISYIKKSTHKLNLYPDSNPVNLHSEIAKLIGYRMTNKNIILGNGSNEILELIVRSTLNHKSEVIIPKHSFLVYEIISKLQHAKVITSKPDTNKKENNYLGIDLNSIYEKITSNTKLIFIANPANPTGTYLPLKYIEEFLRIIPKKILVILDEAYYEYLDSSFQKSAVSLINKYKNLYVTRSFSKIYGLASLRVGYGISNPENIEKLKLYKQPFNTNYFAQQTAGIALKDFHFINESKKNNSDAMQQFKKVFDELSINYLGTYCNFITFRAGTCSGSLFEYLLTKGVIIRPLNNYKLPEYLRVSLGSPSDNKVFIKYLKEFYDGTTK
jgi:histidinol-phosphate aminotransferase